ncbi:hypothetical protein KL86PLE_110049 [uncultured Pleomorphomonas sp.]|uniref:Uncharacterized protein n=1 Tax=uncultured Pleomorphomonas sp. TaxID=442121 RepID=A0A212L745_9HYPH|nr:hypothetical protein [uncultured Pleomorphomonas sp.]SCM73393.1 hypothetical protein KL86PLE_110049 [uncultured Pleomorphomonas sp.]
MADVTVNGQVVDADDPCALYQALYALKLQLIGGESISEIEVQDPVSQRRTRFTSGNLDALDGELLRLSTACTRKTTGRPGRFAKRMTRIY